jgi:predicted nucleic acid-binding protein
MSWLLYVNMLLALRWATHPDHVATRGWLNSVDEFYTCPITELGFLRVSLSPWYAADWQAAQDSLAALHARPSYRFLPDDVDGSSSPPTSYRDTTDAHLVALARTRGLKLATLDTALVSKQWALGIAVNPLIP